MKKTQIKEMSDTELVNLVADILYKYNNEKLLKETLPILDELLNRLR